MTTPPIPETEPPALSDDGARRHAARAAKQAAALRANLGRRKDQARSRPAEPDVQQDREP